MGKTPDPNERTLATPPWTATVDPQKSAFILLLTGLRFGELYKLPQGTVVRLGRSEGAVKQLQLRAIETLRAQMEGRNA